MGAGVAGVGVVVGVVVVAVVAVVADRMVCVNGNGLLLRTLRL
jgi:hypothetical protein